MGIGGEDEEDEIADWAMVVGSRYLERKRPRPATSATTPITEMNLVKYAALRLIVRNA
jgi:hypothetical protein